MLIEKFENDGRCEFIEDFATPFPSYIFLSLMGMPLDQAQQFLDWEKGMLRGETAQDRAAASMGVLMYLKNFITEQRANPGTELIEGVINSEFDGKPLTDGQLLGIFFTFYAGGLDTVYSTLGWTMRHLAMHPDQQDRLRDNPDLIDNAVYEFLRAFSVVSTKRKVREDFTFHGVEMKAGDTVLLPLFLGGRDPKAWDNPHEVDLDRKPSSLAFGSGPHLCAGRQLALREMRIALKAFLGRFKNIRIDESKPYSYHTSPVYGIDELHLTFDRV
jgi:cytochrome P450